MSIFTSDDPKQIRDQLNRGITRDNVKDGEIITSKIADNAVVTDKIADDAVTTDKIADSISLTTPTISQTAWIAVSSFSNSWTNFGAPYAAISYMKDSMGFVHLMGTAKSGTIGDVTMFNLPAGYRPANALYFANNSNGAFGATFIGSDGNVKPEVGTNVAFALDGIIFKGEV